MILKVALGMYQKAQVFKVKLFCQEVNDLLSLQCMSNTFDTNCFSSNLRGSNTYHKFTLCSATYVYATLHYTKNLKLQLLIQENVSM